MTTELAASSSGGKPGSDPNRTRGALSAVGRVLGAWLLACALSACGGAARSGAADPDRVDVEKLPEDLQYAYKVFAAHCSRCHALARPIAAPVRDVKHWDRYVARMMKVPGSGINAKEAKIILRFLHYYTENLKYRDEEAASDYPAPEPEKEPAADPDDLKEHSAPGESGPTAALGSRTCAGTIQRSGTLAEPLGGAVPRPGGERRT